MLIKYVNLHTYLRYTEQWDKYQGFISHNYELCILKFFIGQEKSSDYRILAFKK